MTMQHQIHPDDERLAALAGGDPDVAADTELNAHVSGCSRCTAYVEELTMLRSALAELPDLVPSRRLQLIPPVAEPRAAASGAFLRRLAAPVMAAGFGLVLVGAVGTSGLLTGIASSALPGAATENVDLTDDAASPFSAQELSGGPKSTPTERDAATESSAYELNSATPPRAQSRSEDPDESISELGGRTPAAGGTDGLFSATDARLPWLVILGLGVGLLLAGLYLRFSAQPRAG